MKKGKKSSVLREKKNIKKVAHNLHGKRAHVRVVLHEHFVQPEQKKREIRQERGKKETRV